MKPRNVDILNQTMQYVQRYGGTLAHQLTAIPESELPRYRNVKHAFRIQTEILEGPATLVVGLPFEFPTELPLFFDAQRQFEGIPHLEHDGHICFTRNENLVIDERYPGEVVLECLKKVTDILAAGQSQSNNYDFLKEFEVYWANSMTSYLQAHTVIDESDKTLRELDILIMSVNGLTYFVCERKFDPYLYIQTVLKEDSKSAIKRRCLYVPLCDGTFIKPPTSKQAWTFQIVKDALNNNISKEQKRKLEILLRKTPGCNNRYEYIIFSLPIEGEKRALFGVVIQYEDGMVKSKRSKIRLHPLIQTPKKIDILPFFITRHNKSFLLSRTGGNTSFANNNAVVIGVGAIGSVVTLGMAKAGYKSITVIDHDWISIENVYRHVLGTDSLYNCENNDCTPFKKVDALKLEIQRKYPLTEVIAISKKISEVFEHEQVDWTKVDIVVVCIGSPNIEMAINRYFHQKKNSPPVIHAWVEPLGIGGHVLVTKNQEKQGCYQCLFRPLSDEDSITNLSAFSKSGQSFTQSLGGCGSYFTPYSFLDSEETASLVLRSLYRLSRNQIQDNQILSWKGDPTLFLSEGYKLSERYYMSEEQLSMNGMLYFDVNCPVCSIREIEN
ncbi:ThiF family adenylyltransferase [Paenibacillus yanchengensis]|uniref:ThiF family adenylyltransferase n=1 Tax=Paenibacillus yanchengensis TaxID=2035833 RepID=A0ABW4YFC5_9BACL